MRARGRSSSGVSASNSGRTRSAQSAAHAATRRRSASLSVCGDPTTASSTSPTRPPSCRLGARLPSGNPSASVVSHRRAKRIGSPWTATMPYRRISHWQRVRNPDHSVSGCASSRSHRRTAPERREEGPATSPGYSILALRCGSGVCPTVTLGGCRGYSGRGLLVAHALQASLHHGDRSGEAAGLGRACQVTDFLGDGAANRSGRRRTMMPTRLPGGQARMSSRPTPGLPGSAQPVWRPL